MKFIFRDAAGTTELALPITPKSFEIGNGIKIEIVNIHTIGDVAIGGYGTLANIKIECMFPLAEYKFAQKLFEPYEYVRKFCKWCDSREILRLIITETHVNLPVILENIDYGERDGSGDVYATLSMREYKYISTFNTQKYTQTQNSTRSAESAPPPVMDSYTAVEGDTLSAVARKFYGDAGLSHSLAAYNGIENVYFIQPGQVIRLPDKDML